MRNEKENIVITGVAGSCIHGNAINSLDEREVVTIFGKTYTAVRLDSYNDREFNVRLVPVQVVEKGRK